MGDPQRFNRNLTGKISVVTQQQRPFRFLLNFGNLSPIAKYLSGHYHSLKSPISYPGQILKNLGGARNLAPDPGARNFRIFITPKKFTSFYSKDFLPKLIFLRKGVHHPKFRFSGVREICGPGKRVSTTFWTTFRQFSRIWYFL